MTIREWLDSVRLDVRFAARSFLRTPAFTVTVVLAVALGVGANAAIFSALRALLFRPLPFAEPERLMELSLTRAGNAQSSRADDIVWSFPKFALLRDAQHVFTDIGLYTADPVTISGDAAAAERADGELVAGHYFQTLGVHPLIGRLFALDETDRVGMPATAIISEGLWQRRFDASPSALGQPLLVDGKRHVIIGVMPSTFRGLTGHAEVWLPLAVESPTDLTEPWSLSFSVIGRRAPSVSAKEAEAAVATIGARIDAATAYFMGNERWGAAARPLNDRRVDPLVRRSLFVLTCAVALVLIIACANVAGLLLVRAARREQEVALRLAIGAARGRLVRQLVTESLVLSIAGGIAALGVAALGARLLNVVNPATSLRLQHAGGLGVVSFGQIDVDWPTVLFATALAIVTGLLFGLVPALQVTRRSLQHGLKSGSRSSSHRRLGGATGRGALSVIEIALAVVLLTGAGLMLRSMGKLIDVDPGFDASRLLTMRVNLQADSSALASSGAYYERLLTRLAALPSVRGAAIASCPPLSGGCNRTWAEREDQPPVPQVDLPIVGVHWVTPGWFAVARVPLVRGRDFRAGDDNTARRAVIVSETAARQLWGHDDPIGRPLRVGQGGFGKDTGWVVGVVGDVRYVSLDAPVAPDVYLAYAQSARPAAVVFLRTTGDPAALSAPVERIAREANPNIPAYDVRTMDARAGDATAQARFGAILLTIFATMALLLATIGIYGVISTSVATRMREIGIRIALGATRTDIVRLAVADGALITVIGTALGVAGALAATRMLAALLFGIAPLDPLTFAMSVFLLAATTFAASLIPARRALRADPITALRAE